MQPPNETTARRSQRFIQNKDKDATKTQIKTEDCDDDNDVKPSKRVTPQKSNNSDKTNGSGSLSELSSPKAELRRLQIYGAGPKMPGIKSKLKETTPTKSRMNGNSRAPRQSVNRRNHADPLAKYGK